MLRTLVLFVLLLCAPWASTQAGHSWGGRHLSAEGADALGRAQAIGHANSSGFSLGFLLPAWHDVLGSVPEGIESALGPEFSDSEPEESESEDGKEDPSEARVAATFSVAHRPAGRRLAKHSSREPTVPDYPLGSLLRMRSEFARAGCGLRGPPRAA